MTSRLVSYTYIYSVYIVPIYYTNIYSIYIVETLINHEQNQVGVLQMLSAFGRLKLPRLVLLAQQDAISSARDLGNARIMGK